MLENKALFLIICSKDYYFDSYAHFGIHEEMLKDEVRTFGLQRFDRISSDRLSGANTNLPQLHVAQQASFQGQGLPFSPISI